MPKSANPLKNKDLRPSEGNDFPRQARPGKPAFRIVRSPSIEWALWVGRTGENLAGFSGIFTGRIRRGSVKWAKLTAGQSTTAFAIGSRAAHVRNICEQVRSHHRISPRR